jgi:pimeloyl-ACP methyl ester carboxylesterase
MRTVTSPDGTAIAFDQSGRGPALILVGGALSDRSAALPLAGLLAPHYTVIGYDRRGRGDSGDRPPYSVAREVEDIQALIAAAGGSAYLFGHSSGAALALEAAGWPSGLVEKLALYEPPFIVDDSRPPVPHDFAAQMIRLLESGRRGDMVELFMLKGVSVPAEFIASMRQQQSWPAMETMAHTLIYDIAVMGDSQAGHPLPDAWIERAASITAPTLVMAGGASPAWLHNAAQAAAQAIPGAQQRILEGQTHGVAPDVLAAALMEFFKPWT